VQKKFSLKETLCIEIGQITEGYSETHFFSETRDILEGHPEILSIETGSLPERYYEIQYIEIGQENVIPNTLH